MRLLKLLIPAAVISLMFNLLILVSVVLNLDWVRTRAAGGQFDSFPPVLRFLYFLMALFMVYLIRFIVTFRKDVVSAKQLRLSKLFGYLFVLSTFTQLISRSADERFNAIPAAIIAITFILLVKK